jgi:hypothetical protein
LVSNSGVQAFTQDLHAHGGEPTAIAQVCMDMSAAYLKGAATYLALPLKDVVHS